LSPHMLLDYHQILSESEHFLGELARGRARRRSARGRLPGG
jgi:hypothetical protein